MNRQLDHHEVNNKKREFPIKVVCENIESPENVGMIFRNCEAMGVSEILFTGTSILPPNRKIRKVSRSTDKSIDYSYFKDTASAIKKLIADGYEPFAVEVTEKSKCLYNCLFEIDKKYALIVGSEKHGVSDETIREVNKSIIIPMYGENTSINVVSALTIVLYEITKQFRSASIY